MQCECELYDVLSSVSAFFSAVSTSDLVQLTMAAEISMKTIAKAHRMKTIGMRALLQVKVGESRARKMAISTCVIIATLGCTVSMVFISIFEIIPEVRIQSGSTDL